MSRNWLVTGASRGLGRAIASRALEVGDSVAMAVREVRSITDLVSRWGDRCCPVEHDVRDVSRAEKLVADVSQQLGEVDVLVNNAGRAVIGAVEEVSDATLRDLMDLHLFGPAALVRAVLPSMRDRGGGTIFQMSSQGGRFAFPGVSAYAASKFALEGWSEALAGEVEAFGIRVVIVEPGPFRTAFNSPSSAEYLPPSVAYAGRLNEIRDRMRRNDGEQPGDPERAAKIIVDLANASAAPLRLPLGSVAVELLSEAYRRHETEVATWAEVARAADFGAR